MHIRIKGLVKFFNHVREQLQSGIPEDEIDSFKRQVKGIIQQVETICRQNGGTPAQLPTPSRTAYQFLADLDLENLPVRSAAALQARPRRIHLKNVVTIGEHFARKLWADADDFHATPDRQQRLLADFAKESREIEDLCRVSGAAPAGLPIQSRQVYCWLKFLADEKNLLTHLETLYRVKHLLENFKSRPRGIPVEVQLINMRALYRVRGYRDAILIKCNEGFIAAGEDIWRELLENVFIRGRKRRQHLLNDFVASEDFNGILFELESQVNPPALSAKGHVHDLDASFARVNHRYFGNKMPKPHLKWNRLLTVSKMGHYQSLRDTVMVSISLDHAAVPEYVIDFIMYHELLHKKHGENLVNGRRFVHTPEFRREEQRFARYRDAKSFLNKWAMKHRGIEADPSHEERKLREQLHASGQKTKFSSSPPPKKKRKKKKKKKRR